MGVLRGHDACCWCCPCWGRVVVAGSARQGPCLLYARLQDVHYPLRLWTLLHQWLKQGSVLLVYCCVLQAQLQLVLLVALCLKVARVVLQAVGLEASPQRHAGCVNDRGASLLLLVALGTGASNVYHTAYMAPAALRKCNLNLNQP